MLCYVQFPGKGATVRYRPMSCSQQPVIGYAMSCDGQMFAFNFPQPHTTIPPHTVSFYDSVNVVQSLIPYNGITYNGIMIMIIIVVVVVLILTWSKRITIVNKENIVKTAKYKTGKIKWWFARKSANRCHARRLQYRQVWSWAHAAILYEDLHWLDAGDRAGGRGAPMSEWSGVTV